MQGILLLYQFFVLVAQSLNLSYECFLFLLLVKIASAVDFEMREECIDIIIFGLCCELVNL